MAGIRIRTDGKYFALWCDGCKTVHGWIPLQGGERTTGWTWDQATRTLSPSVVHFKDLPSGVRVNLCHYNITNGRITYHNDSSDHTLRGEMDMVEMPAEREAVWNWHGEVEKF